MSVESCDFPHAYLITFHTYGTWLHGDVKGSVDRVHNDPGTEFALADSHRVAAMQQRRTASAVRFDFAQRHAVEAAIRGVCDHRKWDLFAMNVRTNHVHVVVAAGVKPERVMNDLKSWATRRLRNEQLIGDDAKVWSRHGSTRYLWSERSVEDACLYVTEGQGVELD